MIGGIIGDYVGSTYEVFNTKKYNFNLNRIGSRYTDDTVLMMATIDCYLNDGNYADYYRKYCLKYRFRGYGVRFVKWAYLNKKEPYYSMGNGSAVRAIPIGYIGKTIHEVMNLAKETAIVTHNHPDGIIGEQAMAVSVFY